MKDVDEKSDHSKEREWELWLYEYICNLVGKKKANATPLKDLPKYVINLVDYIHKYHTLPHWAPEYSGSRDELLSYCHNYLNAMRTLEQQQRLAEFEEQKREAEALLLIEQEEEEERFWTGKGAIESLERILTDRVYITDIVSLSGLKAKNGQPLSGEKLNNEVISSLESSLSMSSLPRILPQSIELAYNDTSKLIVVEQELPDITCMPEFRDHKYIISREEWQGLQLSDTNRCKLYNSALYQIALRTIAEVFLAAETDLLSIVVFNGYVNTFDKGTGNAIKPCVMSVQAEREQFESFDLDRVDPKECFKRLKGISAANLADMAPIPPVVCFNKTDKRFIHGESISSQIAGSTNLAMLDWQEFEHLIRELSEWEFASSGGEVKVTRASRDEGVDAVVFDPDPVRGGKLVIQAKRYTNTVELSAVRDLYGTVVNEGAIKGILITTSDFGGDAYEFVKNKPLALINGNNLLHMLEKHGHKARIDIKEAKRLNDK